MTSIRGKMNTNTLTPSDIEFFRQNRGFVPLCCSHIDFADPKTYEKFKEPLYRCDQLKTSMPYAEFEKFCLKCQAEIQNYLRESEKR